MTKQHPITPPPELVKQWEEQFLERPTINGCFIQSYIATQAAQWGADQLAQPKPEGPIATEHARTQEINDLIAETVYGPRGSETSACANAWEVSKLIASMQTRVKALEALDD